VIPIIISLTRKHMAVGFTTTFAISTYHCCSCDFESRSSEVSSIQRYICNKDCQWLATGRWFSPCTPVSFTNKTESQDITEILLKVALNTIILTLTRKLMNQWLLLVKLKSSLRKIYGHHLDFVNSYQISVSQITTHMVPLS
jgi:hypothetical protein